MLKHAPKFWTQPSKSGRLLSICLSPLSYLWQLTTEKRLSNGAYRKFKVPVICVGNINIGGTGKTPTVIDLSQRLIEMGQQPHILSKGYGGRLTKPTRVNPKIHSAKDTGDEPLLLAEFAPTWVANNRTDSAKAAIDSGASVLILDDGFQDPALHKDLSLIVIDTEIGFGNECVIPAGPLREPIATGLDRCDLIVGISSKGKAKTPKEIHPLLATKDYIEGQLKPLKMGMDWSGERVIAFAGIGRPEKFFNSLKHAEATLVATHSFADHQAYSDIILTRLEKEARQKNAQLVTTEKDAVRLPASFRKNVLTFPVRLSYENDKLLQDKLSALFS